MAIFGIGVATQRHEPSNSQSIQQTAQRELLALGKQHWAISSKGTLFLQQPEHQCNHNTGVLWTMAKKETRN
jgi:hypothetical protein